MTLARLYQQSLPESCENWRSPFTTCQIHPSGSTIISISQGNVRIPPSRWSQILDARTVHCSRLCSTQVIWRLPAAGILNSWAAVEADSGYMSIPIYPLLPVPASAARLCRHKEE